MGRLMHQRINLTLVRGWKVTMHVLPCNTGLII